MTSTTNKFVYKVRASEAHAIMGKPKTKGALLTKTGMDCVEKAYKKWKYKREKYVQTNAMAKGTECENEAVMVYNKAMGTDYKKTVYNNGDKMENKRATGHEDIDSEMAKTKHEIKHTVDIKTCADFQSFPLFDFSEEKAYWRQGQVYMRLKGEDYQQHTVAKVLVNTPLWILRSELYNIGYRLSKQYEGNDQLLDKETDRLSWLYFKNNVYDQQVEVECNGRTLKLTDDLVIPYEERVKTATFYRDDKAIAELQAKVELINNELLPSLGL